MSGSQKDADRPEVWKVVFMESLQIGRSLANSRARADEAERIEIRPQS